MKYKAAVIGCGRIGGLLEEDPLRQHPCTHAGALGSNPLIDIAAVCDTDPERLETFGRKWEVDRLYADYAELLEKEKDLDIVSVCTWTDSHCKIVLKACENKNIKGIICEKPMAVCLSEADKMLRAVEKAGKVLVVNHERRWSEVYLKVRRMIREGEIGDARTVIGNVLTGRPKPDWHSRDYIAGGGPLLHDGTHLVDIMRFFFGEVDWVIGHVERASKDTPVDDTARALLRFKNGVSGSIEAGGLRKYFNFELDIQGASGRILVGNEALGLWKTEPSQRYSGFTELVKKEFPYPPVKWNVFERLVNHTLELIEGRVENASSGKDGAGALEIISAVYESQRKNNAKIYLPMKSRASSFKRLLESGGI